MDHFIHISDIRSFKQCRVKWYFSSGLKLNLEPRIPFIPFFLGRGVHHALEQHYLDDVSCEKAFDAWAQKELLRLTDVEMPEERRLEVADSVILGCGMLKHYDMWCPKQDKGLTMLQPEYTVHVPLGDSPSTGGRVWFVGRMDGIIEDENGDLWIMEFKTTARMGSLNVRYDEQAHAYLMAARLSPDFPLPGRVPKGTMFTFLRKKVPVSPEMTTRGHLSRNKRQGTSLAYYLQEIRDRDLDPNDYRDILVHLLENEQYFSRERLYPSDRSLLAFWKSLQGTIHEMLDPNTPIYPNTFGWQCNSCIWKEPCMVLWEGLDPWPLLNIDYVERPRDFEDDKEEEYAQ